MAEMEDDLRAISEDIAADAEQLTSIEQLKAAGDPSDPATAALAEKAVDVSDRISAKTRAEQELARMAADEESGAD